VASGGGEGVPMGWAAFQIRNQPWLLVLEQRAPTAGDGGGVSMQGARGELPRGGGVTWQVQVREMGG